MIARGTDAEARSPQIWALSVLTCGPNSHDVLGRSCIIRFLIKSRVNKLQSKILSAQALFDSADNTLQRLPTSPKPAKIYVHSPGKNSKSPEYIRTFDLGRRYARKAAFTHTGLV